MWRAVLLLTTLIIKSRCQEYDDVGALTNYDDDFGSLKEDVQFQQGQGQPKQDGRGLSAGSGLRSIAEGSSNAANDAVNNQDAAGFQAAYVAKNTLAQSAAGASATAQAALAGKQILLQGLEQQFRDAQQALMGERAQLMQAQRSADSSLRAAQEARAHVNVLTNTLNAAQAAADHVTQAASEAAGELAAQQSMVGSAMQRLDALGKQLTGVRIDFQATQAAAMRAQNAAQAAAANAAAAAAAAAAELGRAAKATPPPPPPPPPPAKPAPAPGKGVATAGGAGLSIGSALMSTLKDILSYFGLPGLITAGGKGKGKKAFSEDEFYNSGHYASAAISICSALMSALKVISAYQLPDYG